MSKLNDFDDDWNDDTLNDIAQAEKRCIRTNSEDEPKPEHLDILKRLFGHKSFKPLQWTIISSIIYHQRDTCAVMSTGYGKSLCFQFPSVFTGGVTFVISPLISLMEDQVLALTVSNIPACFLGTANTNHRKTIEEIEDNKYRLVYLTPEFCAVSGSDLLEKWSRTLQVTLIAIDEAHCVSSWGHDFRGQYRHLGALREIMPTVPILAVTATATEKVRADIIKNLKLRNPQLVSTSLDRPNFYFAVNKKTDCCISDLKKVMTYKDGKWKFLGPTIVYCITRKKTDDVALLLQTLGINCARYHAGLSLIQRKENHLNFAKDKIDVIVATIAFGMGIDKPDIRNIIHYGVSDSMESYYQEVGRAGRDGLPSNCICFYNNADFNSHQFLRSLIKSQAYQNKKSEIFEHVVNYVETKQCRRKFLLSYFKEDTFTSTGDICCDNCLKGPVSNKSDMYEDLDSDGNYDFSTDARLLLSVVDYLDGQYGLVTYVAFLCGKSLKKYAQRTKSSLYGSGKAKRETWWTELGQILLKRKLLSRKSSAFNKFAILVGTTAAGKSFLKDSRKKLLAPPNETMLECLQRKSKQLNTETPSCSQVYRGIEGMMVDEIEDSQEAERKMKTYRLLMNIRTVLANEENCMPYMIVSDKALLDLARVRPQSLKAMEAMHIDGLTAAKLEKFGKRFLEVIPEEASQSIIELLKTHPLPYFKNTVNSSAHTSYTLYKNGKTVKEIALDRSMALSTIELHLSSCVSAGMEIELSVFGIDRNVAETIIEAILEVDSGLDFFPSAIKLACPDEITFIQIKALSDYLKIREHFDVKMLKYQEFDNPEYYEIYKNLRHQKGASKSQSALSQLVDGLKEVEKGTCFEDDDSVIFTDELLTNVCDNLEKSINEQDDESDDCKPTLKKPKKDCLNILDSPPRQDVMDITKDEDVVDTIVIDSDEGSNETISVNSQKVTQVVRKAKKKDPPILPPWLAKKRVA